MSFSKYGYIKLYVFGLAWFYVTIEDVTKAIDFVWFIAKWQKAQWHSFVIIVENSELNIICTLVLIV